MHRPTSLVILSAGKGSRLQSDLPKVLHEVGQMPLIAHVMRAGAQMSPEHTVLVTGHGADAVEAAANAIDPEITTVRQTEQLGTAHAVLQAKDALSDFDGTVLVLYGDTPFVSDATMQKMLDAQSAQDITVLGFETHDPDARYGRLITEGGTLREIVEYKDASEAQRAIKLCNSGVVCAGRETLFALLGDVGCENASGEYYLTDIVGLARDKGLSCGVILCDEAETMGVNTREELAQAEAQFQTTARRAAQSNGVQLAAPDTVIFALDTELGRGAVIEPYVVFAPGVTVESGARIRAFSHLEGCHVGDGAIVGPYARLRPGAELGAQTRVGNFVEVKNATLDQGAKVNHLSYVGDADIGAGANLGAGTVTCNYDGVFKHRTYIGPKAFIGSGSMLVAPVTIGPEAMTASGSVITQDIPEGDLALGRARQVNKPGLAQRLMAKLRAAKKGG